jgi:hypothetical protein
LTRIRFFSKNKREAVKFDVDHRISFHHPHPNLALQIESRVIGRGLGLIVLYNICWNKESKVDFTNKASCSITIIMKLSLLALAYVLTAPVVVVTSFTASFGAARTVSSSSSTTSIRPATYLNVARYAPCINPHSSLESSSALLHREANFFLALLYYFIVFVYFTLNILLLVTIIFFSVK